MSALSQARRIPGLGPVAERSSDAHARLTITVIGAVAAGVTLRLIWPSDMEYKGDEQYVYVHATGALPGLLGDRASVGIPNPGLGQWLYWLIAHLLKLAGGGPSPVGLDRAVMVVNALTLLALAVFALRGVADREREPWLYATAMLAVNPVAILFSRKLWIQCLLAPFALGTLVAWWRRGTRAGAFGWGLLGAWLGQIHMTGLFLAPALALWTAALDRRSVRWRWWLAGSALGLSTLIPWLTHELAAPAPGVHHLTDIVRPDFWWLWLTTPIGRPILASFGSQAAAWLALPRVDGISLHLVAVAAAASLVAAVVILARALGAGLEGWRAGLEGWRAGRRPVRSHTTLAVSAASIGYGLLLSASGVTIYRHYITVAFVLPYLLLALAGLRGGRLGRRLLGLVIVAQLVLSVGYLSYVHVHGGVPQGDYGIAYDAAGGLR